MTTCSNILMDSSKSNNSSSLGGGENKSIFTQHGAMNIPLEPSSQPHSPDNTSIIKACSSGPLCSQKQQKKKKKKKTLPSLFERTHLALIDEQEGSQSAEAEVDGHMSATIPISFSTSHVLPHPDVARLIRESRNCKEDVRDTIMPSTSSLDGDYNMMSLDDRVLLELQSLGLSPFDN